MLRYQLQLLRFVDVDVEAESVVFIEDQHLLGDCVELQFVDVVNEERIDGDVVEQALIIGQHDVGEDVFFDIFSLLDWSQFLFEHRDSFLLFDFEVPAVHSQVLHQFPLQLTHILPLLRVVAVQLGDHLISHHIRALVDSCIQDEALVQSLHLRLLQGNGFPGKTLLHHQHLIPVNCLVGGQNQSRGDFVLDLCFELLSVF